MKIGRYQLLEPLGAAGGPDPVFAAYHPELDRKVALRRVKTGAGQLLRQAQATARLSHANVLAVFDAFSEGDEVIIVTELVLGETLADWLRGGRTVPEVLGHLRAAGTGLAAAHAAGILHGDFRPHHVLISPSGRTLVTELGLATHLEPGEQLAPEQRAGAPASPQADQYAFCRTAWDALYGASPARGSVPARIRRALERGLRERPDARHASMDALLRAFAPRRPRALRTLALGAGIAAALCLPAVLLTRSAQDTQRRCAAEASSLDALWGPAEKARIGERLQSVGKGYAADVWHSVEARLEQQSARWRALRQDACAQPHTLRATCLDHWKEQLRVLTRMYAQADAVTLENALLAAWAMRPVEECTNASAALGDEPDTRQRLEDWNDQRAKLLIPLTLYHLHREQEALAKARELEPELRRAGTPGLNAELDLLLGNILYELGQTGAASERFRASIDAALAASRDDVAAEAMIRMGAYSAVLPSNIPESERWTRLAAALLARRPVKNDRLELELRFAIAGRQLQERKLLDAERTVQEALAFDPQVLAANPEVTSALVRHLSDIYANLGKVDEARRLARSFKDTTARLFGPSHPKVGIALNQVATVEARAGNVAEAIELYRKAEEITAAAYGPTQLSLSAMALNEGVALLNLRRLDEALVAARRSIEIASINGARYADVVSAYALAARVLLDQRKLEQAQEAIAQGWKITAAAGGDSHPRAQLLWTAEGRLRLARCDFAGAQVALEKALELRERTSGPSSRQVGGALTELGELALRRHDTASALRWLERAAVARKTEPMDSEVAMTHYALARALRRHGDLARARELGEDALRRYRGRPDLESEAASVERWLKGADEEHLRPFERACPGERP